MTIEHCYRMAAVASRPSDPSSRHVGRIVDPLVRDDGELEPELSLEAPPSVTPEGDAAEGAPPGDELVRGAALRGRLLERAAASQERDGEPPAPTQGDDLDDIGRRAIETSEPEIAIPPARAPGAPATASRSALSPTVVALFGTLMGMAVIASVTAVAMRVAPQRESASEATSAAPTPPTTTAPEPPPRKQAKKRERQRIPGPYRVSDSASDPALRLLEGRIGSDAFLKAVQAAGVPSKESYRLVIAFQGKKSLDHTKKTDRFFALLDRKSQRLKAFEYVVGPEEVYQAREGADGLLTTTKLDLKVERAPVAGAFVYDGKSLDDSAEEAGFERGVGRVILSSLDGHSTLDELERGDVIRLIVQEITVLGDFARYAGVEALELRRRSGESVRVYYFDVPGERGYYDAKGRSPHHGGWRKPIPGAPITSRFNLKRMHPVLKKVMPHLGTDFGAATGTPIGASAPGTVTYIGYSGPAGNLVKLEHAGGVETGYAHQSRFREGLKVGDKVKRLELLGYVGSTGRSTGPHLHFSASKNKEFFDPEKLDLDGMKTLGGSLKTSFEEVMAKYNPLLDAIVLPEPLPEPPAVEAPVASAAPSASGQRATLDVVPDDDEAAAVIPPPPLPAPPASGAPRRAGSSIYLTDKELLELQGATDDGEVNE